MSNDVTFTSSELLASMHMQVTIRIPRRTMWMVSIRLWLARQLVMLGGWIGGCSIAFGAYDDDGAGSEGEGG